MTKKELSKLKYVISALHDSLSHYIGWNRSGYEAYWESYEEYKEFISDIHDACNIIKKELNNDSKRVHRT